MILKLLRRLPNYDKEMVEQVFGDELKVYWIGEVDVENHSIKLIKKVAKQDW